MQPSVEIQDFSNVKCATNYGLNINPSLQFIVSMGFFFINILFT